ncbi:SDR family oxidoreductase [Pseudomarimonas salicorniae]|uniref:SDR family oxidoreductase n=1 Tax=Pseudomarimonas salicorniae TaxID=2933270 RepID=A0ABT0GJJ2_9GAMM|nr:SDR family oxidoreductase [Lysobacter sp. CAU 1642]MCK7594714.1 SDR family oxidoreductase [Lysobacter sp. CAU 1642]
MDLDLAGRHALVCGGSAGIGGASARELALLGARVTLLARHTEGLEQALAALPAPRGQVHAAHALDLGDGPALAALIAGPLSAGDVDILVNNSGGPPGGRLLEAPLEAFEKAFAPHLMAAHRLIQALVPGMRRRGFGRIVNIVSTSVYEPIPGLGVSNTLRAAVAGWAKTLSRELAAEGITVNNVLPGYTRTRRIDEIIGARAEKEGREAGQVEADMLAHVPAGRMAEAAEVAAAVAFLASPAAAYINGISLAVDGGRMQSI